MRFLKYLSSVVFLTIVMAQMSAADHGGFRLPDPYSDDIAMAIPETVAVSDTIPLQDRDGAWTDDDYYNPFDITPSIVTQEVEYDPATGNYIILEKIGDEYYRTPSYMTFAEYMEWSKKKQERDYFSQLGGLNTGKDKGDKLIVDPMDRIDIGSSLIDRLFGGTEVNIQPQGNVDLSFGFDYQNSNDETITQAQRRRIGFDFDMAIRMNVDGSIGEKLNLGFNYDTQSTFDFDRKIKLEYDSDAFSEDDIIKKIEAGNVSLPLKGSLIQGAQSLFGLKTELQFGHLKVTALASQQKSKQNNLRIENGASIQEFEVLPAEYDENRHFFLSHYHRDSYEDALKDLPFINSSFKVSNIEVWISTEGQSNGGGSSNNDFTKIAAIADLAEPDTSKFTNKVLAQGPLGPKMSLMGFKDLRNRTLPDNRVNGIYDQIKLDEMVKEQNLTATVLGGSAYDNMKVATDFEVFQARKLTTSEFTYHEQLGMISLNIRLRPDQKLGVAYDYFYTAICDTVFHVGELANEGSESTSYDDIGNTPQDSVEAPKLFFVKLLKSSNPSTLSPMWDLMMKNVYSLRTNQLNSQDFEFDIFYDDPTDGAPKKFLPEEGYRNKTLLEMFGLDRLNEYNDPQQDGIFDFVEGVTVNPRNGTIIFPVLEPFGSSLRSIFTDGGGVLNEELFEKYAYQEMYDTSATIAKYNSGAQNRFIMKGKVKSAVSGEISLGPFVPEGSVRVSAGGVRLEEGRDYEIDYSLGRLRIINEAYLSQGTPINVSFEDNTVFSLQQKTMLGLRAEYEFSDNFNIGATYLRLFERPFTQKINVGNDPINNRVFGIDLEYSNEAPWLTRLVDKLPFYSTKEASNINFAVEGAVLKPGHSDAINLNNDDDSGVASIDDFEGAVSGFLIGSFNTNVWKLASTPSESNPEALETDGRLSSINRARLNWYSLDQNQTNQQNAYTRLVQQDQLFNRDVNTGQGNLNTFDLSFYPSERGPYNYDLPDPITGIGYESAGIQAHPNGDNVVLRDPETRWGGVMRNFRNTDFEASNYQFVEFWMLDPYMDRPDGTPHQDEDGRIEFHFGNVSEDILADNLQFYENALPVPGESIPVKQTGYGQAPLITPVTQGFDRENGFLQDVGFDGIPDSIERIKHIDYIDLIRNMNGITDQRFIQDDPAADNFVAYNDDIFTDEDLLTRLKKSSNPENNLPDNSNVSGSQDFVRGNRLPDTEDLNGNNSLDQGESYWKYILEIDRDTDGVGLDWRSNPYIKQELPVTNPNGPEELWYRVQIPLIADEENKVGDISGFRSIQFMRIYMTGFKSPKTFRMAEMELVRNIWRTQPAKCNNIDGESSGANFSVDDVGIEENSGDSFIGYLSPPNIKQEELFNTFSALRQDEKSLELSFGELEPGCEISINKLAGINLTFYEKLQMFTHVQDSLDMAADPLEDGDVSVFVRLGDDSESNYYEYRIPTKVTTKLDFDAASGDEKKLIVWPEENFIDLDLKLLTDVKIERNKAAASFTEIYQSTVNPNLRIIGNPSLASVREIEVGAMNTNPDINKNIGGKIWINELRVAGFKEQAGYAATARLQMQMADLGELNFATTFTSEGWGGLDQKLEERNQFSQLDYDASTSLELSKLLPAGGMGLTIPFFAQFSKSVKSPKFEAYSEDLTFDEAVEAGADRTEVEARSQETSTIKTFNFTNVKKARSKDKKTSYPWDISNVSASYAYTQTKNTDPIIKEDKITEHTGGLDYNYSRKGGHIKPFSFIKNKNLKLISEFNFNLLPNAFTFGTTLNRKKSTRTYRLPDTPIFTFDDQRFIWQRRYGLNWDLTKSLKFTYKANASAVVDELRQVGIEDNPDNRNWVTESGEDVTQSVIDNPNFVSEYRNQNLRNLGRSKNYNHNITATYSLPFKLIPGMDWVTAKADYKAGYRWDGGALITIDEAGTPLGNTITNNQARSGNVTFSFDKLYSKIPYLKNIDKGKVGRKRTGRSRTRGKSKDLLKAPGDKNKADEEDKKKKEDEGPSKLERILVRPLLALRDVKFSYKEDQSTLLPGFMPQSNLLGMSSGFSAPGWGFIGGLQPNIDINDSNNYLQSNVANGYFNPSQNFSDEIIQTRRHNFDLKIGIEPFKDFDIDVTFRKDYQETHTEVFKNKASPGDPIEFIQNAGYDFGSFEATYSGLSTLFKDNGDLYQNFIKLREQVSNALPNKETAGQFNDDFPNYAEGFGPDNSRVLIPAFLGAYTNKTIGDIDVNESLDETLKDYSYIPKPNWTLKYDGLSKLSMFKDVLSNFSLTHGYKSSIRVNRFNSQPEYDEETKFEEKKTNENYYSRVEVPTISIDEQFAPVLGVSLKTKADLQLDFEYRKSRRLDLGIAAGNLTEVLGTEYIAGFAYTIKNFQGFGKKKKSTRKKKDQETDDKKDPQTNDKSKDKRRGRGGNVNSTRGRNITMNFDFSYSDDVTWIYRFKEELSAQPQRGQVRIFINPYVDYEMNENLNLRFFFEYSKTKPYSRTSFDRTNMEGGITVQFKLN